MDSIVSSCLADDSQISREMIKIVGLARCCTNIELGNGDITTEEYNMLAREGIIELLYISESFLLETI